MVRYISDRIGVIIVEIAESEELYKKPLHPYTKGLFSALLIPGPKQTVLDENENSIQGELPSPINIPKGCRFRSRCPYAMDVCAHKDPTLQEIETGHFVACHLYDIEGDKVNI
ncbi:ABC transporter ATP-binding protein [Peribacillus sp. FSL H8-0477]|uniref:ABC transporter ATP-binding protein n=1 Tax=Peribacillus sp. FSL H8-0477 TaxID=2921388 RepID=UPI0030FBFA64